MNGSYPAKEYFTSYSLQHLSRRGVVRAFLPEGFSPRAARSAESRCSEVGAKVLTRHRKHNRIIQKVMAEAWTRRII